MHVTQLHEVVFSGGYIYIYRLYFVITWLCCDCIFVYSRSAFLLTRKTCFFCVFQILWKTRILIGSYIQNLASYTDNSGALSLTLAVIQHNKISRLWLLCKPIKN